MAVSADFSLDDNCMKCIIWMNEYHKWMKHYTYNVIWPMIYQIIKDVAKLNPWSTWPLVSETARETGAVAGPSSSSDDTKEVRQGELIGATKSYSK